MASIRKRSKKDMKEKILLSEYLKGHMTQLQPPIPYNIN